VTYPWEVLRRLLTPRWVASLAGLLVVVAACVLLGMWQLGVARDSGRQDAIAAAATLTRQPLAEVTAPHRAFPPELSNRPVTVTGRYDASRSFVVVDRRLGDRSGSWVVTPLDTGSGTVAVLRGFVAGDPATAPAPPAGPVTVLGTLGPGESPRTGDPLQGRQRRSIDLAELVNEWPRDLYDAVVFASAEHEGPDASGALVTDAALTRVPPPTLDTPLNLRNAAYAVQWWVFGIFAIWMWWKMLRAAEQDEQDEQDEQVATATGMPSTSDSSTASTSASTTDSTTDSTRESATT
jgi:cytochrome oxidase assembly protein ShyY1